MKNDDEKISGKQPKRYQVFVLAFLLLWAAGCKQQTPEMIRIGIISSVDSFNTAGEGFISKMKELGYEEGHNITYDFQKPGSNSENLQQTANKMVVDKKDLILAFPTGSVFAVRKAAVGSGIPIVFTLTTIDGNTLADDVQKSEKNIAGVRFPPGSDLLIKRFEILMEMIPGLQRVLLFHNTGYPVSKKALAILTPLADSEGIELLVAPISSLEDVAIDLKSRSNDDRERIGAVFIMPEPILQSKEGFELLCRFTAKNDLPIIGGVINSMTEKGILFSYIPDFFEAGALAAPLADKILKGALANSLPVVTPEPRLKINLKVAKKCGLEIPEGLLKQASEIIH